MVVTTSPLRYARAGIVNPPLLPLLVLVLSEVDVDVDVVEFCSKISINTNSIHFIKSTSISLNSSNTSLPFSTQLSNRLFIPLNPSLALPHFPPLHNPQHRSHSSTNPALNTSICIESSRIIAQPNVRFTGIVSGVVTMCWVWGEGRRGWE